MGPTRRDILHLSILIAMAAVFGLLLDAQKSLGQDVSDNALARAVSEDRFSPAEGGHQRISRLWCSPTTVAPPVERLTRR
jgi:hypothetical protein